jgi:glycosyltransferase involved in cell wall biosynthesis
LERQIFPDFEVLVVDDGSTDATPRVLKEYQEQTRLHLRFVRQENGGPACARNRAIANLDAPVCLMIGDDIFAAPDLILRHLELHRQRRELNVAGLGYTQWSDTGQTITPFMRWLDESGVQFAYADLVRGVRPDWKHFYTSNISLKTQLLRENPFNEAFTKAATEDLELGYRLEKQRNLELVFLPDAVAQHLHPTSFRQACRRMINVGQSTRLFSELWPSSNIAIKDLTSNGSTWRRRIRDFLIDHRWALSSMTLIADLVTDLWCPNPLMRDTLRCYYALGYGRSAPSDRILSAVRIER